MAAPPRNGSFPGGDPDDPGAFRNSSRKKSDPNQDLPPETPAAQPDENPDDVSELLEYLEANPIDESPSPERSGRLTLPDLDLSDNADSAEADEILSEFGLQAPAPSTEDLFEPEVLGEEMLLDEPISSLDLHVSPPSSSSSQITPVLGLPTPIENSNSPVEVEDQLEFDSIPETNPDASSIGSRHPRQDEGSAIDLGHDPHGSSVSLGQQHPSSSLFDTGSVVNLRAPGSSLVEMIPAPPSAITPGESGTPPASDSNADLLADLKQPAVQPASGWLNESAIGLTPAEDSSAQPVSAASDWNTPGVPEADVAASQSVEDLAFSELSFDDEESDSKPAVPSEELVDESAELFSELHVGDDASQVGLGQMTDPAAEYEPLSDLIEISDDEIEPSTNLEESSTLSDDELFAEDEPVVPEAQNWEFQQDTDLASERPEGELPQSAVRSEDATLDMDNFASLRADSDPTLALATNSEIGLNRSGKESDLDFSSVSGVNLLDPNTSDEPVEEIGPKSSIFGKAAAEEASKFDLDTLPPVHLPEEPTESLFIDQVEDLEDPEAGSSIFDKTVPVVLGPPSEPSEEIEEHPESNLDSKSDGSLVFSVEPGVEDWEEQPAVAPTRSPVPETDFDALAAAAWSDDLDSDSATPRKSKVEPEPEFSLNATGFEPDQLEEEPEGSAAQAALPRGSKSVPKSSSASDQRTRPFVSSEIDEDEPRAKPESKASPRTPKAQPERRKSGAGAWVGGSLLGLLIGSGAFAGLYFGGVLPGQGDTSNRAKDGTAQLGTSGLDSAELAKLNGELEQIKGQLTTVQKQAKTRESELLARVDAEAQKLSLATKERDDAAKAMLDAKKSVKDLEAAMADAKKAQTDTETMLQTTKKLFEDTDKALKDAQKLALDTKKLADDKVKELAEAEARFTEAQKKLSGAETTLGTIVKELKSNKLIDEKDDLPAALTKVPEVLKQAAAAAVSADAKKAAEALAQAQKQMTALQLDLKKADTALVQAREEAKLAKAEADKAKLDAEDKAKKAVDLAKVETAKEFDKQIETLQKKLDESMLALKKATDDSSQAIKKAQDEASRKLALAESTKATELKKQADEYSAQLAQLTEQIALVRAGGRVSITPRETEIQDRASAAYASGVNFYFSRKFDDADQRLSGALKDQPNDARYWYFKGLVAWELGRIFEAEQAFKKGAELEVRNLPNSREIGIALERVQGNARKALNAYRP